MITKSFVSILCIVPLSFSLASIPRSDITFEFYSQGIYLGRHNETSAEKTVFNTSLSTKLILYGYLGAKRVHKTYRVNYDIKGGYNIVFINWSKVIKRKLRFAIENLKIVASTLATFIKKARFDPERTHIISSGLGSHVGGLAGREYRRKHDVSLSRITALSPSYCDRVQPEDQLRNDDADMVDTVMTDIQLDKCNYPYGNVDFIPNGGYDQPGCNRKIDAFCNEARSTYYFVESILRYVVAKPAINWNDYLYGQFVSGNFVTFGENLNKNAVGVYYIRTDSEAPYLLPL